MSGARPARPAGLIGRVSAVHGRHYRVEGEDGQRYECVSRGKRSGIACGDSVSFTLTSPGHGAIEQTLARRNLLYRSDHFRSKLLAANVDQVYVVVAGVPTPDIDLMNRCLVACAAADIPAFIVVNKADLAESRDLLHRLSAYPGIGYPLISLSAHDDCAPLARALAGTAILIGASGVGKSTLINALVPEAQITTQAISFALDTGRHTTTHTRLYHLDRKRALIDSPGMQEFGLAHVDARELATAFPEFRAHLGQCRFYNCRHLKEPGCAILGAVAAKRIAEERWRVYRDLSAEAESKVY